MLMGVDVEVVDAVGVERGCPSDDAVHLIALGQEEFSQIASVLSRNACHQCCSVHAYSVFPCLACPDEALIRAYRAFVYARPVMDPEGRLGLPDP
jgi:hypothetical protein